MNGAKYLKFDPFIHRMRIVYERGDKKGPYNNNLQKFKYHSNTLNKHGYFNDVLIIECSSEAEVFRLKDYTENN